MNNTLNTDANHFVCHQEGEPEEDQKAKTSKGYFTLLGVNYLFLFLGSVSASLLSKFYFNHKGSSRWVSTWVQCGGFPLLLFPIFLPYYLFKCTNRKPFSHFTPKIFSLSIFIGLLLGVNNLLFSWGNSYLPVSTSSLLLSSQLVFNLIFSVLIAKQKLTFSNLNAVTLLTLSSVLLALDSALATVGMSFSGGFAEMKRESLKVFDLGKKMYWVTVFGNVVTWQLCFMGTAGMVFLTSSLTGAICMTAILAINVIGGVVVYGDNFGGVKVVSTVLCTWGFCSYVYGMYVKTKEEKERTTEKNKEIINGNENNIIINNNEMEMEMAQIVTTV
ncbi:hypothetical protein Pint_11725 [Pistacia integerrima]|uniref:Uncharacterized protein n=1 Tax=Pistacia integerrima TaxID=434235 RepID=A0ACC0XFU4_9ROSI|nr:hypothetical protein Pint_11725 [Pistacia integerrima]